ncbi:hypothetical protein EIL87_01595 [Saccharopolyspora rhizosphaerae]|uniref:XRE family transcriptional regulator n=1 Tax=Saccharopolyspora rhizosphaerae TaxID=2492662 RepID=A0A426K5C2_9PSEU|nr:hypothetical protein [Saccharopolyspora rhizosphaerae]RRO20595.1 hypothetical protein EIL87_01595 [Saccharopolyspora rhizosphaerae]
MPATEPLPTTRPRHGGPQNLDRVRADVARIIESYPHERVFPLYVELRDLRDRAFKVLERRVPAEHARDWFHTAGLACAAMANAAFDLGHPLAAEAQARTAFQCAEQAGDNALRCWIRGTQSLVAYWEDRCRDAVELARDGRHHPPGSGTAAVRLAALEARAHARLGDAHAAERALTRAEQAREEVVDTGGPAGLLEFPVAKQYAYASSTALWLGGQVGLARAERDAITAIAGYAQELEPHRRVGELCLARLDLAAVRLRGRDLEGAAEQVDLVLAAATSRRTEAVLRRLRRLGKALERTPLQAAPAAVQLRDKIGSFCAAQGVSPLVGQPL